MTKALEAGVWAKEGEPVTKEDMRRVVDYLTQAIAGQMKAYNAPLCVGADTSIQLLGLDRRFSADKRRPNNTLFRVVGGSG